jgi:KaiC/GvpD/RAD55 family RecA-like ATPase
MVQAYVNSSTPLFSEFFEVTNGGLSTHRMTEDVDVHGNAINIKSRFTIGVDVKAHHYVRFYKMAYFNEQQGTSHNLTTFWIQPNGSTYRVYQGSFGDYKDDNITRNYWEYASVQNDALPINASTPTGSWRVEVYLDRYLNSTWRSYGPVATTPFIIGNETVADWTFMVYLDADNNLERPGNDIFLKMASVGSTARVNVVVQMDRSPASDRLLGYDDRFGNWTDAKRFYVTQGITPTPGNATEHLGEVNMGHPNTLRDFINWTITTYPADKYFLVLWDHGTGAMGLCFDVEAGDFLSLPELSEVLRTLPIIVDVVFSDACSMNMIEIAYQIREYANFLVGPEGLGYSPAPYEDYLGTLVATPSMAPSLYAQRVVTDYIDWCTVTSGIGNATMSAVNLNNLMFLKAALEDFAIKLEAEETPHLSVMLPVHDAIIAARNSAIEFIGPFSGQQGYYIDLHHLARLIDQSAPSVELGLAARTLITSVNRTVMKQEHKARPFSSGLSVFFPDEKAKYDEFADRYEELVFADETAWDEFLKYHLSGHVLTVQTPYPEVAVDVEQEVYTTDTDGRVRVFVTPGAYSVSVETPLPVGLRVRRTFTKWSDNTTASSRLVVVDNATTLQAVYTTQYQVFFTLTGVDVDFSGQIVVVDGSHYSAADFPPAFWWDNGSSHNYAFQSHLVVTTDAKRYAWNTTTGLSSVMSGAAIVSSFGNVTGNYATQFYLDLQANPSSLGVQPGVSEPGPWYMAGVTVNCSAPAVGGHTFSHWTVNGGTAIQGSSVLVTMDGPHQVVSFYVEETTLLALLSRFEVQVALGLGVLATVSAGTLLIVSRKRGGLFGRRLPGTEAAAGAEGSPNRLSTGYGDLDDLLMGGIPKGYAIALNSPSCDEKDLLIQKFVETGVTGGEVTFHITIDPGDVLSLAQEFKANFYLFICNPQASTMTPDAPNVFKLKGVENLTDIDIALISADRRLDPALTGPRRACVELVSDVLLQHHAVQTRKWLAGLLPRLKSKGFTILAVMNSEMHPQEEANAVLDLFEGQIDVYEKEAGQEEKFLKVRKLYNQKYQKDELELEQEKLQNP